MARISRDTAEYSGNVRRHNLSIQNGKAEVFVAGQPAWHRLGVNVEKAQSWKQAIKLAHLDWSIRKEQLHDSRGEKVDAFGLFRDDNNAFLASTGNRYTPIQNEDAFTFVDALIGKDGGCHYITAGALGKGDTIWCLAQTPWDIKIRGTDDITKSFLLFADHRDGKAAISKLTTTRVVCNNTLNASMYDGEKIFRLRHTSGVVDRMKHAKNILSSVKGEIKSLDDKMNILARKKATNTVIKTVMEKLFPKIDKSEQSRNRARDILERYELNDNNAFPKERGTAFNLLNAFTGYIDHDRSVRVGNFLVDAPEGISLDTQRDQLEYVKRAESSMFGTGDAFKTQALQYILEATEAVPTLSDKQIFDMSRVDSILSQVEV